MSDQAEVYRQFESYDFANEDFQNGLLNVFDSYLDQLNGDNDGQIQELVTEIPSEDKERLTMQAKTFYFCSNTGEILNIDDYLEWKRQEEQAKSEEEPEYSTNYQEVVELILQGKEVPGIKQIPDTVLEGQSTSSIVHQRKKPWETEEESKDEAEEKETETETETEDKPTEETNSEQLTESSI